MELFKKKKKYTAQGLVQFADGKLAICGDIARWLDAITVEAYSEEEAHKEMFNTLKEKYPEYGNWIQLF